MSRIIGSWSFYRRTLLIAVPIMIQNLITNFVALVDNIMVGQVGTEQMSGVSIVNQLLFVFNLAIFGALSGAGIFCAQFFGKKDVEGVRHTMRFKFLTGCAITGIGIAVFLLLGDDLIRNYLHDAEKCIDLELTFNCAKSYLRTMLIGLVPFALEQVYSSTLREGGRAMTPMVAGIVAVVTNTLLNYLLIFGIGPFPEMGVDGAAIATVISRFVQAGIVMIWAHSHSNSLPFIKKLYCSMRIPSQLAKRITVKGLIPLTLNESLWAAGVAMLTQQYSLRGVDVVAGLNISSTVVNLFNVLFIAFGSGVSVVIGQLLGSNDLKGAKEAAPKLIFFSGALCVVVGSVMACFSGLFPAFYNTTDEIRALASSFILISAVLMPIHGILHATYFTLRSGGKTIITFIFDCGFSWLISVPLAFCLANFTTLSIIPLYLIVQSIESVKCIVGLVLIKKGVWLSNIVSEKQ